MDHNSNSYSTYVDLHPPQIISTDDATAVEIAVWINENELFLAKAVSRRDPIDPVNPEIGLKLALGRAIRQLGRDILKEANMLVSEQDERRKRQTEASDRAHSLKIKRAQEAKKAHKR